MMSAPNSTHKEQTGTSSNPINRVDLIAMTKVQSNYGALRIKDKLNFKVFDNNCLRKQFNNAEDHRIYELIVHYAVETDGSINGEAMEAIAFLYGRQERQLHRIYRKVRKAEDASTEDASTEDASTEDASTEDASTQLPPEAVLPPVVVHESSSEDEDAEPDNDTLSLEVQEREPAAGTLLQCQLEALRDQLGREQAEKRALQAEASRLRRKLIGAQALLEHAIPEIQQALLADVHSEIQEQQVRLDYLHRQRTNQEEAAERVAYWLERQLEELVGKVEQASLH